MSCVVRVSGVTKAFRAPDGEIVPVIDMPAFSVAAGEQVAIRGGSGTGKTTFLNLLAGILTADAGSVEIAGTDIGRLAESARDRHRALTIGYVFQNFNLLQGYTAVENVLLGMLFGSRVDRARAARLLDRVGMGHRLHYRPAQLSVGQQQRVAVARALANRPAVVLADEPTGNLDAHHAAGALALIREVCREEGAALVLVSHDPVVLGSFARVEDLAALNRVVQPAGSTVPSGARA